MIVSLIEERPRYARAPHEGWCKSKGNDYDVDVLFAAKDELREIVTRLHICEVKGADFFRKGLPQICKDCKLRSDAGIEQLKPWHRSNGHIEGVCAGDTESQPATYDDTAALSGYLAEHLKSFQRTPIARAFSHGNRTESELAASIQISCSTY